MSIAPQPRKKNGQFMKLSKKAKKKTPKPIFGKVIVNSQKPKETKVLTVPKLKNFDSSQNEVISPKLKRYINERIRHQNDYILECLHIFLMDLEGALERDQLDWED
jgi:hypothetical protein